MPRHTIRRDRLVAELLADDPDMLRRYDTSATFRQHVDTFAAMAEPIVEAFAEQADRAEAEVAAARELARGPHAWPLSVDLPMHGWGRAEDHGTPHVGPDAMRWTPSDDAATSDVHPHPHRGGSSDVVSYYGHRPFGRAKVIVTRCGGVQEALPHVCRHSPDGFEWGYGGSGPADLALSLLAYHRGEEPSTRLYQAFKHRVVAHLHPAGWTLQAGFVDDWLARNDRPGEDST